MLILFLLVLLATFVSLSFKVNVMWSVVLFMLVPATYLSWLLPGSIKKSLHFALVTALPLIVVFDLVAVPSKVWFVSSLFQFRLFGVSPIEELLWAILAFYLVVMFYEYFFDTQTKQKFWSRRLIIFVSAIVGLLAIEVVLLNFAPELLVWPFAYLWIALIAAFIPILAELFRRPQLAGKFFFTGLFFFFHSFLYEIAALKLGWWSFPSQNFIGWFNIFNVAFPFEEFLAWFLLAAMATLAYYEFFADDER